MGDLSDNEITEVRDNSFSNCKVLVYLELTANRIHTVQRDAFAGAPMLKSIVLSDNQLTKFQEGTFHLTEGLSVEAYENKINCDCQIRWFKQWSDELLSYDPSTEIRYTCHSPARNQMKRPNEMSLDDFSCLDNDTSYMVDSTLFCNDQTVVIVITCLVTFFVSMILAFVVGRFAFHCIYGKLLRYTKARQSSRFDEEDEIIHEMG